MNEVVKQLEDEKEYAYANFEEYVRETCPWFDADHHDTFANGLVRAVEIIKKGNGVAKMWERRLNDETD